ncbi:H-NS histone family protein [Acidovorax sp. PRC11]|uniref:H-NS histone family protein n=2 Tax=Comamonadaceae TaxID=80864 RepID=UPI0028814F4C|nr:H-NS histone family protein [Acidovorax sp. PRC11]MDT0136993.1 H-NS histone family protein [Acidovorax sp. PRC11]
MPKTLGQMRKRLEEAMGRANDAEAIIPLMKEVIAQYDLLPGDLFDQAHPAPKLARQKHPTTPSTRPQVQAAYQDGNGNTWAGRGRRPTWLNEALERGHTLEDFKVSSKRLTRAK